jgi:hypothetical protein
MGGPRGTSIEPPEESPMPMIEIWDGAAVRLSDMLDHVPTDDLDCSVMELWAVAGDDDTDVVGLEQQAAESPTGFVRSGEELRGLAGRLTQVIDGILGDTAAIHRLALTPIFAPLHRS